MEDKITITENVSELRKLRRKRRRTNGFVLGVAVNIFAIVGIISIIIMIIQSTLSLFDNTKEKKKLEEYLLPVVMNDITTFENVSAISDQQLKMIALWGVLVNNEQSKYKMNELNYLIVPASEFEMEVKKLFGPDLKINHGTFQQEGSYLTAFVYNPEINSYEIDPRPRHDVYSPKVMEIHKVGDEMSVLVGLVPPEGYIEKNVRPNNYEPEPDQYREFILKTVGSDMQIIKVIDRPELHPKYGEVGTSEITSTAPASNAENVAPTTESQEAPEVG